MKKIILIIFSFLLLTACSGVKTYDEINLEQLNKMLNAKESFILFACTDDSNACDSYKVTLNNVIEKYNLDVKYINLSKLSKKQSSQLTAKIPINETPTTLFIENGEEKDTYNRINGDVKYSKIISKLKQNEYIKE